MLKHQNKIEKLVSELCLNKVGFMNFLDVVKLIKGVDKG